MSPAETLRQAAKKARESRQHHDRTRRDILDLVDAGTLADLLDTEADEVERTGRVKPSVWTLAQDIQGVTQ